MKKNSIISKSISSLLLVVMLYMHVCSALCATGGNACCGKEDNDNDNCSKNCCENEKNSDNKDHDCQNLHFSFFNTTGQFAQEKSIDPQVYHSLVAVITPLFIIQPIEASPNIFAYNRFHPPPLKTDIRISIRSFQI